MARKEEFHFLSSNQEVKIHAVKWIPESGKYNGILQIHHGMVEYIDRYDEFASFIAEQGFLVVGSDHAGHGQSIHGTEDFGYFGYAKSGKPSDVLVDDMHTLRHMIQNQEMHEDLPYFMLGHSMGSYMLRKYLTKYADDSLTGAIIVGTGDEPPLAVASGLMITKLIKLFRGDRYRSKMVQQMTYSKPYHQYDLTNKDLTNSWLSKNVESVKDYLSRPECTFLFTVNGYQGLFEAVSESGKEANVQKQPKQLPLLLVAGDKDPVGNMGKGVQQVYDRYVKLGMQNVEMKLYEGDRHEILNELDRREVYEDIWNWMKKSMTKES